MEVLLVSDFAPPVIDRVVIWKVNIPMSRYPMKLSMPLLVPRSKPKIR